VYAITHFAGGERHEVLEYEYKKGCDGENVKIDIKDYTQ